MIISYQWLLEYLPIKLQVNELGKILTSIGLEVEAIEPSEIIKGSLQGLVIGEVLDCKRHPNADKLSLTSVSVGGAEPLQIVCGAPNVAVNQKVVVALVGTTVYPLAGEPFLIKKAKIRGEESCGMICAEDEIGLGESHAGIIVLPAEAVPGTLASVYYNIPPADYAIHIGLTPNRSDANSHIGVAKDVCAYLSHHSNKLHTVSMPANKMPKLNKNNVVNVNVESAEACPRYAGICLTDVKVGDSPDWLKNRLNTIGVRSINNIVDITNYVLHEYGQPLHAFDLDKVGGKEINVKFLLAGTPFIGLDKVERKLLATDLMICDSTVPMAIGGVFGGTESGITTSTTNIFIESAYFDPKHIRRTSMHHILRTDAAQHFEKGVDIENIIPALNRAALLIVELADGKISSNITDNYPQRVLPVTVKIGYAYIEKLSGKQYSSIGIKQILSALGFIIINETDIDLAVSVPTNKPDVTQPADIVEEILRIDGLDNIEIPKKLNISLIKSLPNDRAMREKISDLLCGMGLNEIVTNSIVNSKYFPGNTDMVKMINNLSSELDVMRPSIAESGLEVINFNCNRKNNNLCLFEFGNIYYKNNENYLQESRLAIWATGKITGKGWEQNEQVVSIYYLKGLINNLLAYSGINKIAYTYQENEIIINWKNKVLCKMQKIASQILKEFDIKQDVFFADIYWDVWVKATELNKTVYKEIPKFPAVKRDLAIVLNSDITYSSIIEATEQLNLEELKNYELFDIFEDEKLGKGKKSYALNYVFQVNDRTLTDAEVENLLTKLTNNYKSKLNAQIRE